MSAAPGAGGDALGIGVIGLGFMGRTHLAAWEDAAAAGLGCRVVAVCDADEQRRSGVTGGGGNLSTGEVLFDPSALSVTARAEELLADPTVDIVSITTPTDSHVKLALAAIAAGKHVLLEKPVALTSDEVARLAGVARSSGLLVMPALCIRFWPGWSWLVDTVSTGSLGALVSLAMTRRSARPDWNDSFYGDVSRSGGVLFDLHIHDADLIRAALGEPSSVFTTGGRDHVSTAYDFADGPEHVVAEGGWDHSPGFPFHMGYTAIFEGGTADFDSRREVPLRIARAGQLEDVVLPDLTGYDVECRELLAAVARGDENPPATLGQAWATTRLLEAEAESLATGQVVGLPEVGAS